jgi:thioredoxin-like negative regulator of GroEL
MMNRRTLFAAALAAAIIPSVSNATETDFTMSAFQAAQKSGKRILVDVWASWCPTCKAQGPILKSELAKPENKDLVFLRVNFDTQTDVLQAFKVQQQSTLIMFKGDKEVARSVGDTTPDGIAKLVSTAQ